MFYNNTDIGKIYENMFVNYPDVVTPELMSEMLSISKCTAYKLLKDKKIECLKIGNKYKIPKISILKYLKLISY